MANPFRKLILISFYKILLAGIIYIALRNTEAQPNPIRFENKILDKDYFLSLEYYKDIYLIKEQEFDYMLKWHCLSKLKLKSFDKFYQTLLLLSGDIALNPGPVPYPCSKCQGNVGRDAVLCTKCNMWIHRLCQGGLSKADLTSLSKSTDQMSKFVCTVCRDLDTSDLDLFEPETSFQFQEEHVQNVSLDDPSKIFKQKGLHFLHLNCNSLPSKIEELRQFVSSVSPHVFCFSETKLDKSILDGEIGFENYSTIRKDRNRNGGGVACFIHKSLAFEVRSDFPKDFENIFIDILLPKTKPILLGVIYRPPSDMQFVENLNNCLSNSNSFNSQEVILLGDFNVNLIDRNKKLIHEKGYRFSRDEKKYSTSIHLTKHYSQLLKTNGFKQIINDPTRITDTTESLLDHILVNTPNRISQSGVISKGISDHDMIYCTRKHFKEKSGKHNSIKIRSMKKYSPELFLEELNKISFPDYSTFQCVNAAYSDFISKLMSVIDKIAPIKEIRVKGNSKPWFDGTISERIKIRDKLRKKYKKSGLQIDFENFKNAQKQANNLIKTKKCDFVKNQLKANIAKPSKLWKVLKSLGLSAKCDNSKICLKNNCTAYFEPKETSSIFKNFYENLAQSLVDILPESPNVFDMNTTKAYYEQFNIESTLNLEMADPTFITDLLSKTNISKAAGIDKLSGTFIKDGASFFGEHLTKIINLSIQSSDFPDPCKIAKLITLFKKGSRTEPKNYRPILLLPLFSIFFEKLSIYKLKKLLIVTNFYIQTNLDSGLNILLKLVLHI